MENKKTILTFSLIAFVLVLSGCEAGKNKIGPIGSTHKHADIKVYILGNAIDFSQQKYQLRDKAVHFENKEGDVVHTHATGITLGYMFETLGMNIEDGCFTSDTGNKYCKAGNAELGVFVKDIYGEWEQIYSPADYIIQDLDKIVVTYGTLEEEGIKKQMDSVTDKARVT